MISIAERGRPRVLSGIAACALLASSVAACRSAAPPQRPISTHSKRAPQTPNDEPRPVEVAVQALLDAPRTIDRVELRQSLVLSADDRDFGGYSGMALIEGGSALLAVSDRGTWLRLELRHDPGGRLVGVGKAVIAPILDLAGRPVGGRMQRDAESLAWTEDGWIVGFEGEHRLWRYSATDDSVLRALPTPVREPREIHRADENSGFEAVTSLADGGLLILAEELIDRRGRLRGWIGKEGRWRRLALEARGAFRPTSLTSLPDGDAILVERSYSKAEGVRVRVSRLDVDSLRPGRTLRPETLATLDATEPIDNLEAADVRVDASGQISLYLLSDDNFSATQRTLLLQVSLHGLG